MTHFSQFFSVKAKKISGSISEKVKKIEAQAKWWFSSKKIEESDSTKLTDQIMIMFSNLHFCVPVLNYKLQIHIQILISFYKTRFECCHVFELPYFCFKLFLWCFFSPCVLCNLSASYVSSFILFQELWKLILSTIEKYVILPSPEVILLFRLLSK